MKSRILGIDIGGTDIKFGVVEEGTIISKNKIPTLHKDSAEKLVDYIADECKKIIDEYQIIRVGIGIPGDIKDNVVIRSVNLPFENLPLADMLSEKLGVIVNIENDANCAALGEITFGEGKNYKNMIMLTVGTGIGGCIIVNNQLYRGGGYAGELGHMIIEKDGKLCSCGQKGCFEQYASTTALVTEAKWAAEHNKNSVMYRHFEENGNKMDGKVFFKALSDKCNVAEKVFDSYTDYFAEGLKSIAMVFDPEIIVLSGGITKEGDAFLSPIVKKLTNSVMVKVSTLQGDAGILGASLV